MTDLFKTVTPAVKSNPMLVESNVSDEKIHVLINQTINDGIKSVESRVESVKNGLIDKINQINVSLSFEGEFNNRIDQSAYYCVTWFAFLIDAHFIQENINGTFTYASTCDEYYHRGNKLNGSFLIRPNSGFG